MTDDRESANSPMDSPSDGPKASDDAGFSGARDDDGFGRPGDDPGPQFKGPDFGGSGGSGGGGKNPFSSGPGGSSKSKSSSIPKNPISAFERGNLPLQMAKMWIQENQTTAMLGAFAVGAFVGAMLRD